MTAPTTTTASALALRIVPRSRGRMICGPSTTVNLLANLLRTRGPSLAHGAWLQPEGPIT